MGIPRVGLQDVSHGTPPSRLRLLAPLRYLAIANDEKSLYDFIVPLALGVSLWVGYSLLDPQPRLFGDMGLLRFTRDLLIMAVPFLVGALAAVAMGAPGPHLERRPVGAPLYLDGRALTLRQFVCYLLGYLCFLGLVTLGGAVVAELLRDGVLDWTKNAPDVRYWIHTAGSLALFMMLSFLTVTVFWSLYFLTDIVNRPTAS